MPNRKYVYVDMDKFLKTRNAQRKRYYHKTAFKYPFRRWTPEEDQLVIQHTMTDMELSDRIFRSVGAIQTRRTKLKKENN